MKKEKAKIRREDRPENGSKLKMRFKKRIFRDLIGFLENIQFF